MYELQQDEFTYKAPNVASRLDRFYTNLHTAFHLGAQISCTNGHWDDSSRHRTITCSQKTLTLDIPNLGWKLHDIYKSDEWAKRVRTEFYDKIKENHTRQKPFH